MRPLEDFNDTQPGDLLRCRPSGLCYFCVGVAEFGRPILVPALCPEPESAPQWDLIGAPRDARPDPF